MAHVAKNDRHAQVSVAKCIKIHGDRAVEAMLSKFGQIHKYDTFDPQVMEDIPKDIRREAFHLITTIKEKINGNIKARACTDGRKQRVRKIKVESLINRLYKNST